MIKRFEDLLASMTEDERAEINRVSGEMLAEYNERKEKFVDPWNDFFDMFQVMFGGLSGGVDKYSIRIYTDGSGVITEYNFRESNLNIHDFDKEVIWFENIKESLEILAGGIIYLED